MINLATDSSSAILGPETVPRVPIGDWFTAIVEWIIDYLGWLLDAINAVLFNVNDWLATALNWVPALVMVVILAALALWVRGWQLAVFTVIGMLVIQGMRYNGNSMWSLAMDTLSLVIVAGVIAMILALPLGIMAARNDAWSKAIKPVLDFMQTLPAFVYLIPALFFFSVGTTAGLVSTIIFAMPPGVRLTELGIRQVDPEMVEAGEAFGSTPSSVLTRVQIPLAMPTIMAGVNQVIMLALSMVVIGTMVGAGGLGVPVLAGISRLDVGVGFEGGLAVVIIAIFLDRMTAGLGDRSAVSRAAKATAKSR